VTTNDNNKNARIDIAPESLRTIAHQEMMLAGFIAEMRKPIWDGTYDLEHLQVSYEMAVGLGRDGAACAIAALAAWARVYPVGHGSDKRLTGVAEVYPTAVAVILPPSGRPFRVVGSAYAAASIREAVATCATDDLDSEEQAEVRAAGDMLLDVVAHRDHLHAQVTDYQATLTRYMLDARSWKAKCAGFEARANGEDRAVCKIVEGDPLRVAWDEGWDLADKFADRVANTVREVKKYAPVKP